MLRKKRRGRKSGRDGGWRMSVGQRSRTASCGDSKRRRQLRGLRGETSPGSPRRHTRRHPLEARHRRSTAVCQSLSILRGIPDARYMRLNPHVLKSLTPAADSRSCPWKIR